MADVVDLRSRQPVSHAEEFNSQLVQDLARFSEGGLVTEQEIRRRYQFDDAVWESLATNEALFAAIEDEKTRRIRNGQLKRERSQKLITQAPDVLGSILCDHNANPRHRIDSAKTLDDFCTNPAEAGPSSSEKFTITINLGDETLRFEKNISIDVNPKATDTAGPQDEWLPMIPSKKDDGDGNAI